MNNAKIDCLDYLSYPYSILGIGEILIPGVFVNYAINHDTANRLKIPVYTIVNIISK